MKNLAPTLTLTFLAACGGPDTQASSAEQPLVDEPPRIPAALELFHLAPGSVTIRTQDGAAPLIVSGRIVIADGSLDANLDVLQGEAWITDAVVTLNQRSLPFVPSAHGYSARIPASEFASSDSYLLEVTSNGRRHSRTLRMPGALTVNVPTQVNADTSFAVSWGTVQGASRIVGDFRTQGGWYGSFQYFSGNANRYVYSGVRTPGDATLELRAITEDVGDEDGSRIELQRMERRTIAVIAP